MGRTITTYLIDGDPKGSQKAADFCLGSSSNGWISWKTENGQTLDSVYRKQLE